MSLADTYPVYDIDRIGTSIDRGQTTDTNIGSTPRLSCSDPSLYPCDFPRKGFIHRTCRTVGDIIHFSYGTCGLLYGLFLSETNEYELVNFFYIQEQGHIYLAGFTRYFVVLRFVPDSRELQHIPIFYFEGVGSVLIGRNPFGSTLDNNRGTQHRF